MNSLRREREFVCVVGNQRCGKSVWSKAWSAPKKRLLVVDPVASYPNVDFQTPPEDYIPALAERRLNAFRYGAYHPEEVPMFAKAAEAAGDCSLVIEECGLLFMKGERLPPFLKTLIFMGGHSHINVDLVFVAQRAVSIPLDVRSQAQRIVSFRQTDPQDVSAICERIGREHEDALISLPKLHCLDWSAEDGRVRPYRIHP
jgi:hypothetical protein